MNRKLCYLNFIILNTVLKNISQNFKALAFILDVNFTCNCVKNKFCF